MKTFIQFLREYKRDETLRLMGDQLKVAAEKAQDDKIPNLTPEEILKKFEAMDPTSNKQYVMWLVREYRKQQFKLKDTDRLEALLKNFERVKSRLSQWGLSKDINQYTAGISTNPNFDKSKLSLDKEINAIVNATLGQPQTNATFVIPDEIKDDVEILYNGPFGVLTRPKTQKASCELGRGTKWCTAARQDNRFDEHNKKGPLYIWRDKNGEKYQFHFQTRQFKDARNEPITTETLNQFRTKHPILKKFFQQEEATIATDPYWAYAYARNVIKGRFPKAEATIATHPYWAYEYARYVIKGRFPAGEAAIATIHRLAYWYAREVIKGRFPEGEAVIATDPEWAYFYAFNVIKGRWPEGEAAIAKGDYKQQYQEFLVSLRGS